MDDNFKMEHQWNQYSSWSFSRFAGDDFVRHLSLRKIKTIWLFKSLPFTWNYMNYMSIQAFFPWFQIIFPLEKTVCEQFDLLGIAGWLRSMNAFCSGRAWGGSVGDRL